MTRLLICLLVLALISCTDAPRPQRVLVFSHTKDFRHASIEDGVAAIKKLGRENGFEVFHTEDPTYITEERLAAYSAVVFLNTTQDVLNNAQQADFERYIQAGGGFVGVHSAADTEYDWPWYGKLVGGYFHSHPEIQEAQMTVVDADHPATEDLPVRITRTDEWYNYKNFNESVNVLIELDESSYEGGNMGERHPIAWYHEYDGGRAFYTGWGHTPESYQEETFLTHLLGGIRWAMGENRRDYRKAVSHRIPLENRFQRTILADNLNEPMELDVFPDGRVIVVERKGVIRVWDPQDNWMDSITTIPVWSEFEDGLMGVAVDPNYEDNHWVYLYYSPPGDEAVNQISRFTYSGRRWDYDSEKVILKVPTQRVTCCHSGGSLEFDRHGNLYLSTGDDTNPFDSDGYAPIDERPGREPWDAQGTSSNTNDLRGKILRIHPEPDGSYTIPEGNLFAAGTPGTRPEIYVMGLRNPFRISIDQKRDWLYWGDVGPDAGKDHPDRGPKGLDEINQARKAGYYGWPYFRGDGQIYHDFDFVTGQSGPEFNPQSPINESVNNTGLRKLPPFQPSLIWYSYDESQTFPWVGTGGKNPMAGPVFYASDFADAEERFPDYFDDKLFIYEWMRNWIYVIHLDSSGNFIQADPFMPSTQFSRPMDMAFGSDGALYLLEYGQAWFARNKDARLSRIEYVSGNRAPIARIEVDKSVGAPPLTVYFSGTKSEDLDGEKLRYEWTFTDSKPQNFTAFPSYTFERPGIYRVRLRVTDESGNSDETFTEIQVGNEPPHIAWHLTGNRSFYWPGTTVEYRVEVADKEDGSLADGSLPADRVQVAIDYLPEGYDLTQVAMGHQTAAGQPMGEFAKGKELIEASDCKTCHAVDKKINGPSYLEIARRYADRDDAKAYLSEKIIQGGGGNWGETAMSAHPQLSPEQTMAMAQYILSLGGGGTTVSAFPVTGSFTTVQKEEADHHGAYVLMATYADRGHGDIRSITSQETLVLRYPRLEAERYDMKSDGAKLGTIENSNDAVVDLTDGRYIGFRNIDLTNVGEIRLGIKVQAAGQVLLRLDKPDGAIAAKADLKAGADALQTVSLYPEEVDGPHDLYVYFQNMPGASPVQAALDWVYFGQRSQLLSHR